MLIKELFFRHITTIEDAIYLKMKNNLSFVINKIQSCQKSILTNETVNKAVVECIEEYILLHKPINSILSKLFAKHGTSVEKN